MMSGVFNFPESANTKTSKGDVEEAFDKERFSFDSNGNRQSLDSAASGNERSTYALKFKKVHKSSESANEMEETSGPSSTKKNITQKTEKTPTATGAISSTE